GRDRRRLRAPPVPQSTEGVLIVELPQRDPLRLALVDSLRDQLGEAIDQVLIQLLDDAVFLFGRKARRSEPLPNGFAPVRHSARPRCERRRSRIPPILFAPRPRPAYRPSSDDRSACDAPLPSRPIAHRSVPSPPTRTEEDRATPHGSEPRRPTGT